MAAVNITFIAGEENGDVGSTEWRDTATGYAIKFPLNKPVKLDPDNTDNKRFVEHVIMKARKNHHFKVEDIADAKQKKAKDE